ncbi:GntR family transcriptional regulator [Marinimicrococcus flavescens]|uniref:GntR family transcriptional regulator n=1 Tax=Marinimicrococcus flavescens TaxID=3031815 RepID=UPI002E173CE9
MGEVTVLRGAAKPARPSASLKPAQVAARIREMIIQDELPPGAPIRERVLAERLAVSRTPLREALKILSAEGLVELQPRRGAVVTAPGGDEVRELLQLLGVIEAYAGELACASATDEEIREVRALHYEMLAAYTRGDRLGYFHRNQDIHRAIVATTRNRTVIEHHRTLNARVYRVRYICNLRTERWESAIREHEKILAALERRDAQAIAAVLKEHVVRAWDVMQRMFAGEAVPPPDVG